MCGIGFFARYKTKKLDVSMIKDTFESLESRGTDASGLYYERIEKIKGKDIIIAKAVKAPFKASELWPVIQESKHALNGNEYFIMLHSRAKTQGTQYKNVNNHPVFSENYVMVHNGSITSDEIDFYPYKGEVDTEVGVSYMEIFGMEEGLSLLEGSISFIFKIKKANEFFLFRHHNPMNIAYNSKDGILCGTSEKTQLPYKKESDFPGNILSPGVAVSETDKYTLYGVSLLTPKPGIKKIKEMDQGNIYNDGKYVSKGDLIKQAIDEYKKEKLKSGKKPKNKLGNKK